MIWLHTSVIEKHDDLVAYIIETSDDLVTSWRRVTVLLLHRAE